MSDSQATLRRFCWKLAIATPFFAVGAGGYLIGGAAEADPLGRGLLGGMASMVALLLGALIVASSIAQLLAEPWGSLFFPGAQFDRPQPMYGIPEARRKEGRYEESFAGFAEIVREHPQQLRAYIALIDVAIVDLKDVARAETVLQEGLSRLRERADREQLIACFEHSRSMLHNQRDGLPEREPITTDRMKRRPQ